MPVIKVKSEEVKIKVPLTTMRIEPTTQTKTVKPSIEEQVITPDEGIFALSSVTVNPVTSEIDENIKAENIKEGVSILGVEGNLAEANPSLVNINDYLETTITSENCEYFFLGNVFKKFPENFVTETTDVTNLLAQYRGTFAPYIDTSNVTRVDAMFANSKLITLPEYNFGNVVRFGSTFTGCTALENIGGFKDLGKAYQTSQSANYARYRLDLSPCTNLTEQSLINVLNGLYDIASIGVKTQQCILGSTNLAKLTSEEGQQALARATEKGWTIS